MWWLLALRDYCQPSNIPCIVLPPSPPIENAKLLENHPGKFNLAISKYGIAKASLRLNAWKYQNTLIKKVTKSNHLEFLDLPKSIYSDTGYLRDEFIGSDPTHANEEYGKLMLLYLSEYAAQKIKNNQFFANAHPSENTLHDDSSIRHPYIGLPDNSYWKQSVSKLPWQEVDPISQAPFKIRKTDKVATAGSCFAQHISKKIRDQGFNFLVTEEPIGDFPNNAEAKGFYDFTARYGNIYTARQLLQLFDRAFGYFEPIDKFWKQSDDRFCDPFRPRIEPEGFISVKDLLTDRQRHLKAVKQMFLSLDVIVFTLGLTECWISRLDGAAFPIAPGVAGGQYIPAKYKFVNFSVDEITTDLKLFISKLRIINSKAKIIFTVSPVPLAATYENRHVFVSTTYSKSVLRVSAEMVSKSHKNVFYFPSYEIITGQHNRGRFFGEDLRSITQEGVNRVMTLFMSHLTNAEPSVKDELNTESDQDDFINTMMALSEAACDEELLEKK